MLPQVFQLSVFYFTLVFLAGALFGSVRIPYLQTTLGSRYAELLEMPLMLFVIWQSAQLTIYRMQQRQKQNQYIDPVIVGALAVLWLITVELATTAILQGGWWNGVHVYFAGRDAVAGPVYGLALLSYAMMPWYVWASGRRVPTQEDPPKWAIDFDGTVDEVEPPDHEFSWF
jgi:hypothetical protein